MIVIEKADLMGSITGVSYYLLCIFVFVSRLAGRAQFGHWIGAAQVLALFPIVFLLVVSPQFERPILYYVQILLFLIFILLEILLDYVLTIDFRHMRRAVIPYVMLFFAATGGMLGVISLSGRNWMATSVVVFLIMAALAFIQRSVTGL